MSERQTPEEIAAAITRDNRYTVDCEGLIASAIRAERARCEELEALSTAILALLDSTAARLRTALGEGE